MSSVGSFIREERERVGLGLLELAAKLGMDVERLGRMENNLERVGEAESWRIHHAIDPDSECGRRHLAQRKGRKT